MTVKTSEQQYMVADLDPFSITKRLMTVEGPLSSFRQSTLDMLLGATVLCVDPTHWLTQEVRFALGRSVSAHDILAWLWGMKAPTPKEQMTIIRHVGSTLQQRFEDYKAMQVPLPTFAPVSVPSSLVSQKIPLPRGTFSDGETVSLVVVVPALRCRDGGDVTGADPQEGESGDRCQHHGEARNNASRGTEKFVDIDSF